MINRSVLARTLTVLNLWNMLRAKVKFLARRFVYWSGITAIGLLAAGLILIVSGISLGSPAHALDAGPGEWVGILFGNIFYYLIIGPMSMASILMGYIMQVVITYPYGSFWENNGGFVNVSAVQVGWKLVRDVCNVFFSLILIIIALANVLKIEAYSWKTLMPKFVLMAILINFSKAICGIATDFGTVAMATFGGSFADSFFTGVLGAFGLPTLADFVTGDSTDPSAGTSGFSSVMLGYILAAIMTLVFFVVITTYTVVLIFRIIMLWFLIVMSPLAYITRILPQTKKYSSQWWEMFGRYVTVGPLITFFLWLSLTMSFGSTVGAAEESTAANPLSAGIENGISGSGVSLKAPASGFKSTSPNVMANFLIALMMLMASMQLVSKMASEAGKITGAVEKFAWDSGKSLMKLPGYLMRSFGVGDLGSSIPGRFEKKNAAGEMVPTGLSKFLSGAGGLLKGGSTLAGATIFDPGTFKDKAVAGFQSWRKNKAENLESRVAGQQSEMLNHGNVLGQLAGLILAHRTSPEHAITNYTSPEGIARGIWNLVNANKKTKEADDKTKELEAKEEELKSNPEFNRFETKEEAQQAAAEYEALKTGLDELDTTIKNLKGAADVTAAKGVTLQTASPEVQAFVQQSLSQLEAKKAAALASNQFGEADKITAQMAALNKATSGSTVSYGDLAEYGTYSANATERGALQHNAMIGIRESYDAKKKELEAERDSRGLKLVNSSVPESTSQAARSAMVESLRSLTSDATAMNFAHLLTPDSKTGKERAVLVGQIDALNRDVSTLRNAVAAKRPTEDYGHALHRAHAIQEANKKLADTEDTGQLLDLLDQAGIKKDQYMAEAIIKKITAGGDLDQLTTWYLKRHNIKGGSSDAAGLELFRKQILDKKLGMNHHDSMRIARDAALTAGFGPKKQTSFALAYKVSSTNGQIEYFGDDARRTEWVAHEYETKGMGELRGASSALVGSKKFNAAENKLEFTPSAVGRRLVKKFGKDMGYDHNFKSLSSDLRMALSEPQSIALLRADGVDPEFINKLIGYRASAQQGATVRFAA